MKAERSKELRVGAMIAVGLLVIFLAFFTIGNQEGFFAPKIELKAKFSNVEGLIEGAPVRLGGVKVGSVQRINFTPDGVDKNIIVVMSINSDSFSRIKRDSNARLGSQGLLGDRTVDITVGSPEEQRLLQGEYVNTVEAPQFGDLISRGGDALGDIKVTAQNAKEITWKINHGNGSLAQIINDPRLYTSLDSLLNMWSDITLKINKGEGFLARLVNDSSLYVNLTQSLGEIRDLTRSINAGEGTFGKMAKEDILYTHIDSLLIALQLTLDKINGGEGTAGQLVNNTNMYDKVNTTMDALNTLIVDIRQNPKKYVKLSLF